MRCCMRSVVTVLACAVAWIAAAEAPALAQQSRTFRLGLITPPAHVWNQEAMALGETLRATSGGRFAITVFPSGQLGAEAAMLQQLQTGALDMAWLTTAEVTTRVPDMAALHAPFLVRTIAEAGRLLRTPDVAALLDKLPQATGAVGHCFAMTGMRQILSREPLPDVATLSGKRFRITPAPPIRDFFELLGAAPVPMPLTQVYDALANGQVDAIDMDYESIINFRYFERAPHMLVTNHHLFGMVALMSGRVWAGLPAADRALVRTSVRAHCDRIIDRFVADEADKLARLRSAPGLRITQDIDARFFGDVVARWDALWGPRTPFVARLRLVAAGL